MVKITLQQDGEIVQEMEGKCVWGAILDKEQTGSFAIGRIDATILPIRMAIVCAELLRKIYGVKTGSLAEDMVKRLFELAIEECFENEPDDVETTSDIVQKVEEDE